MRISSIRLVAYGGTSAPVADVDRDRA